ncbi:hypothetical protein T484DRAFT_3082254 [Baffinella frigidus]|nr:hypothetical protein T484DRAFT_3082254 [Cryptophyta sp. CCMP2293]
MRAMRHAGVALLLLAGFSGALAARGHFLAAVPVPEPDFADQQRMLNEAAERSNIPVEYLGMQFEYIWTYPSPEDIRGGALPPPSSPSPHPFLPRPVSQSVTQAATSCKKLTSARYLEPTDCLR